MKTTMHHDYGLILMMALASIWSVSSEKERDKGIFLTRKDVCDTTGMPMPYLSKIAQSLSGAGLITIKQGSGGGFLFTMDPDDISFWDIYRACNFGPVGILPCINVPASCTASKGNCGARNTWVMLNGRIEDVMRNMSLSELIEGENLPKIKR